jgi:hypothetical protein
METSLQRWIPSRSGKWLSTERRAQVIGCICEGMSIRATVRVTGVASIQKKRITGDPDERFVSTSYVERQNLSLRMGMRRFTRLTNAFSNKIENYVHAVNLFYAFYNLCRSHQTLTKKAGKPTTPAMAAGIEAHPWSVSQLCALLDSN